jgi:ABC-2 type transport system ATP-binding protein
MSSGHALEVSALVKSYGAVRVLDGISFCVARGEIFALLGANGAGKTSTVEILAGYRQRDGGRVSVLGLDPGTDARALAARVGIMLQEGGVPHGLSVREALGLYAAFYEDPFPVRELIRLVGLTHLERRGIRSLSGGERQRVSLAMAVIGRPELLFLDEPTAGMDAAARQATWGMIRDLVAAGTTIVLTTHYLREAEELAHRVGILHAGRMIAIDTPEALVRGGGRDSFSFSTATPVDRGWIEGALGLEVQAQNGWYSVSAPATPLRIASLTAALAKEDVLLTGLRVGNASLEEAFLRLTDTRDAHV